MKMLSKFVFFPGKVITRSWDKTLKCWDPRGASGKEKTLIGTYSQPEHVYSMSLVGHPLVVATTGRHINLCMISITCHNLSNGGSHP